MCFRTVVAATKPTKLMKRRRNGALLVNSLIFFSFIFSSVVSSRILPCIAACFFNVVTSFSSIQA